MKFSSKVEKCGLSPMRQVPPGTRWRQRHAASTSITSNIGQPDGDQTPPRVFRGRPSLPSSRCWPTRPRRYPELIDAIQNYYDKLDPALRQERDLRHRRRQRSASDRAAVHSRRRRRNSHSRAVLPQLQHDDPHLRCIDSPDPDLPGGGVSLR